MKKYKFIRVSKYKKLRYIANNYNKRLYIVFLPGFASDIEGEKPKKFLNFSIQNKLGFLALEYYGHGRSSGEFIKGIRYDEPLPIIVKWNGVYFLIDGFHRVYVLKDLGQISWAFDYYEINDGYDIEDLYDEIGLGANNHPPSSKATRKDFLTRAVKWSKREAEAGRQVTKEQVIEWIDGIEHSFTDKVVENIANDVIHARHIDRTFVSFTDEDAAKYLKEDDGKYTSDGEIDEQGFAGRLVRAEANGTYGPRNFTHILKDARGSQEKKGRRTKVHVYIPSNKVKKEGSDPLKSVEDMKKELNDFWDCVRSMHYKLEEDPNYCPFEFGVRPTQILETDPDGGVIPLD